MLLPACITDNLRFCLPCLEGACRDTEFFRIFFEAQAQTAADLPDPLSLAVAEEAAVRAFKIRNRFSEERRQYCRKLPRNAEQLIPFQIPVHAGRNARDFTELLPAQIPLQAAPDQPLRNGM